MSDYSMADISSLLQSVGRDNGVVAKHSTSRKNNTDLDMTDFLKLMVVQLQSQSIDDAMDTSEMMNQLVQMQMVSAITNMTETNIMTYASSLVGKEVTIGIVDGNHLEERPVTVTGTAMSDGSQVIFGQDEKGNVETYNLSQIMAVGRLPDIEGIEKSGGSTGSGAENAAGGTGAGSVGGAGSSTGTGSTGGAGSSTGAGSVGGAGSSTGTGSTGGTGGSTGTGSAEGSGSTGEADGVEDKAPVENPDKSENEENSGGGENSDSEVSGSEGAG